MRTSPSRTSCAGKAAISRDANVRAVLSAAGPVPRASEASKSGPRRAREGTKYRLRTDGTPAHCSMWSSMPSSTGCVKDDGGRRGTAGDGAGQSENASWTGRKPGGGEYRSGRPPRLMVMRSDELKDTAGSRPRSKRKPTKPVPRGAPHEPLVPHAITRLSMSMEHMMTSPRRHRLPHADGVACHSSDRNPSYDHEWVSSPTPSPASESPT